MALPSHSNSERARLGGSDVKIIQCIQGTVYVGDICVAYIWKKERSRSSSEGKEKWIDEAIRETRIKKGHEGEGILGVK